MLPKNCPQNLITLTREPLKFSSMCVCKHRGAKSRRNTSKKSRSRWFFEGRTMRAVIQGQIKL